MATASSRARYNLAIAVAAAVVVTGCSTDPQSAGSSSLTRRGYELVGADAEGNRAFSYSGEARGLVSCSKDGTRVRIGDVAFASKRQPGKTLVQDSTLDSYAIVTPDGSRSATYVLTVVRNIRQSGRVLARDVETVALDTGTAATLRPGITCSAR